MARAETKAEPTALDIQAAEQAAIEKALHPFGHHGIFGSVDTREATADTGLVLSGEQGAAAPKAAAPKGEK